MKRTFFCLAGLLITASVFSQTYWSLTGNGGTTTSNFLGTTDTMPLIFKVNNQWAGFTGSSSKNNVSFGYLSMTNARGNGIANTAIGAQSLQYNNASTGNVAVGTWALQWCTQGDNNTAVGLSAMGNSQPVGNNNVAIGQTALFNNKASENTAVGAAAMYNNTTGTGLTGVGYRALVSNTTGEFNTAIGYQSLRMNTIGYWNVALGSGSLQSNTTGYMNTAGGNSSMFFNQTGHENTAFGEQALGGNIDGYFNTAMGNRALWSVKQTPGVGDSGYGHGKYNTAVGYESLRDMVTGEYNVAVGVHALRVDSTGTDNIGIGCYALTSNKTGGYNVAVGNQALSANISGSDNVAIGDRALTSCTASELVAIGKNALYSNTSGIANTATGASALRSNMVGNYNTAYGYNTLYFNTGGYQNTAIGCYALRSNMIGFSNTATGMSALRSNTTGYQNTANGLCALYSNIRGNYNTANGTYALYYSGGSDYNVANGYQALLYNNGGSWNTANGTNALYCNTFGNNNTADGYGALSRNTTGCNNTAIGYYANVSADNLSNATAIGYNAIATASNQVRIGNTSVASIGGNAPWTNFSDGRAKKNIRQDVPGLAFINRLHPVTYTINPDAVDSLFNAIRKEVTDSLPALALDGDSLPVLGRMPQMQRTPQMLQIEKAERELQQRKLHTGFVAQDVEKAAKSVGYDFDGVDVDENGIYGLRYSEFVVPLVKAVQELSQQNDSLKHEIAQLEAVHEVAIITALEHQVEELTGTVNRLTGKENQPVFDTDSRLTPNVSLEQNFPNPFNHSTTINYTLPQSYYSAKIVVTDVSGRVFKQNSLNSGAGASHVKINTSHLSPGVYYYSLYVDNTLVDSKKMIVTK